MTKRRKEALASLTTPTRMLICTVITCLLLILSHYTMSYNNVDGSTASRWACISGEHYLEGWFCLWRWWPPPRDWEALRDVPKNHKRRDSAGLQHMDQEQATTTLQGIPLATAWKCPIRVKDHPGACSATPLECYGYFCRMNFKTAGTFEGGENIDMQVSKPINYVTIH